MSSFDMFPASHQDSPIEAVVKWFNLTKGFGFVAPIDGSTDAFIHSSVISKAGLHNVAEGSRLLVQIGDGMKGRQVLSIVQVLGRGEAPPSTAPRFTATNAENGATGTVKWFKADKGFGFVTPDDGGRDIFVHRAVVLQAGLQNLESGQKVRMTVHTAAKGREAATVELIG